MSTSLLSSRIEPLTMPADSATVAPAAAPRLAADTACLHCGYNLRGVAADAACPECGLEVRISLRADRLAEAPAHWLRRVRLGVTLLFGAAVAAPLLLYFALPIAAVGAWVATSPQPGRVEPRKDEQTRWTARLLLLFGAVVPAALMAWIASVLITDRHSVWQIRETQLPDIALIAGNAAFWMGLYALVRYLDTLADRIPSLKMLRAGRTFRAHWLAGLGVVILVALASQVAEWLFTRGGVYSPWAAPAFAVLLAIIAMWLWIATLRYLRTVRRTLP